MKKYFRDDAERRPVAASHWPFWDHVGSIQGGRAVIAQPYRANISEEKAKAYAADFAKRSNGIEWEFHSEGPWDPRTMLFIFRQKK